MKEAAHALFGYAFAQDGIEKILARYVTSNDSVHHVAQILGFQTDGVERAARWMEGSLVNITQASLLRKEWLSQGNPYA